MTPVEELREAARLMREDEDTRWHAVAYWLDITALGLDPGCLGPYGTAALAVARAYLGIAR